MQCKRYATDEAQVYCVLGTSATKQTIQSESVIMTMITAVKCVLREDVTAM